MKATGSLLQAGHRRVSILCAIALLLIPIPSAQSQDLLPELVRRIKPSAVAIETFDSRGEKLSRGSGFFIDSDRVVTNRHVIDNADFYLMSFHPVPVQSQIVWLSPPDVFE